MPEESPTPFDQGLFLVHLNRGKELFDKRQFSEAAEELEQARRMRPSDDTVLNLLGLVYFKNERYREADKIYTQLIEVNPDSEILHFNHGLVCFKSGHLDRAEAAILRALEQTPEKQKVNFYLGNIYEKKKQYYNAIFQYRKAGANIMVKRVQSKIDTERGTPQEEDKTLTGETLPPPSSRPSEPPEATKSLKEEEPPEEEESPTPLDLKVTVDHIDKTRFLSALRQKPFSSVGKPPTPTEELPLSKLPLSHEAPSISEPVPPPEPRPTSSPKPTSEPTKSKEPSSIPAERTVVELTEPVLPDVPLTEMKRDKTLTAATENLFVSPSPREERPSIVAEDDAVEIPSPVEQVAPRHFEEARLFSPERDKEADSTQLYSRLRRRDDIFRYLESNLMEVNFSGKVFIKQGTIYSYSGNLTFWVKPQRKEEVSPLVIVSGTGKLILSDRQREITVLQLSGEEVFVEPSHLLACQESLTPRYAIIKKEVDPRARFQVLAIEGKGMIALSVVTSPLLLKVTSEYPANVSSANVISWSGNLTPSIVENEALTDLMFPHSRQSVNLRLEGTGKVMMEKLKI
jgi:uncharacterized protein (AIM24 family)